VGDKERTLRQAMEGYKQGGAAVNVATLSWDRDLVFVGETRRGYEIEFDAAMEWGCMPMESLMLSLAGCMGIDVMSMLKKMRVEVSSFRIEVGGERNPIPPQYFKAITMTLAIAGKGLTQKLADRAVALSREKYCSVYHSLRQDLQVAIDCRVTEG
jgi:putative redox protein